MKSKIIVLGITLFTTMSLFAGCGKKEIDYNVEKEKSKKITENQLAQFKGEEQWKEEWKAKDQNGNDQTLGVNADIEIPELENMPVVEVKRLETDKAFREQFLKSLLGETEIYYHDKEHYIKSELEDISTDSEELLAEGNLITEQQIYEREPFYGKNSFSNMDEFLYMTQFRNISTKEAVERNLQEAQELLPKAPEDYVIADEYESCNQYAGYLNDILLDINFDESYVSVKPANGSYYGPETLCNYDNVSMMNTYNESAESMVSNECKLSPEEAKSIAEGFIKDIGRGSQICTEAKQLMWRGENLDENANVTDENYAIYGYSFKYGTGINGTAFSQFPDFYNFSITWAVYSDPKDAFNGDEITLIVTDDGIVDVAINSPVTISEESGPVDLLPLDSIKTIIKNELPVYGEKYDFDWEYPFDNLQLMYLKIKDDSNDGVYSYVPVWCLSEKSEYDESYYNPMFINAMDGSIIYIVE